VETEISPQQLRVALQHFPTPAIIVFAGSTIAQANRALAELTGLPNPDAVDLQHLPYKLLVNGEPVAAEAVPLLRALRGETITGLPVDVERTDGRMIHVIAYARPMLDDKGQIAGAIATFFDVHEQRELEAQQRDTQNRLNATADRLLFLAQAGEALSETLDVDAVLQTLQGIIVPRIAPFMTVMLLDEHGRLSEARSYHQDPVEQRLAERSLRESSVRPELRAAPARVARTGISERIDNIADIAQDPAIDSSYRRYVTSIVNRTSLRQALIVPMRLHGRTLGILSVAGPSEFTFTDEDTRLLEELGRRAASALENAQSYQRHQHALELMQHALLPAKVPQLPDYKFDVVYTPGDDEALIGGDWYDAFMMPDGRIAVSIGDVTGRGFTAAVLMGKVRHSLSALSFYETDPAKLLDGADKALRRRTEDAMVTAFMGIIDPESQTFVYATAGHPPPFIKRRDGSVLALPCHGLPLGLRVDPDRTSPVTIGFGPDDVLLLYTDGLTESTHDLIEGENRVRAALRGVPEEREMDIAHYVLEQVIPSGSPDDVAILSVRACDKAPATRDLTLSFDARDARMAHEARRLVATYLRELGAPDADYDGSELVFGELIGNVVRHAPGEVEIEVGWDDGFARLCVRDRGFGYASDRELPVDPLSENGRGLFLINALTRRFSVTPRPNGGMEACAILHVARKDAVTV
jgi:PAS domain S-box-containing protein